VSETSEFAPDGERLETPDVDTEEADEHLRTDLEAPENDVVAQAMPVRPPLGPTLTGVPFEASEGDAADQAWAVEPDDEYEG
jgi:hypothetical protein